MTGSDAPEGFWRDRPTLVTGATGFLGSHLTGQLVELGAAVVVLVRDDVRPTPVRELWGGRVTCVSGDVVDQPLLERVLGEYEVRTVFHLAAQTLVGVANNNPVSTFDTNIRGTWSLLEAARRSPLVEQVVVASSDKAYGSQSTLPYSEDMPLLAIHPYDVSKACGDMLAMSYHQVHHLPVALTRCGNFYGPGDTNWNRLVPGTVRSLLRGDRPILRSDGSLIRDYLYITDAALAYLRLAEAMAGDPAVVGEAFNFSTERPMTVLELAELIRRAVGRLDLELDIRSTARHEIEHQHLSAEKARRMLGWKPHHTVEDAIEITVGWYRQFLGTSAAP